MSPEKDYELHVSVAKLGRLAPITKAADGEIIDGNHRDEVDPDWKSEFSITLESVKTPTQKILASLALNLHRRTMGSAEKTEKLRELKKLNPDWTVDDIAKRLGVSKPWVWRYLPSEFKDEVKAEAGRAGAIQRRAIQELRPTKLERCGYCGMGAMVPTPLKLPDGREVVLCDSCHDKWITGELSMDKIVAKLKPTTFKLEKPFEQEKPVIIKDEWKYRKERMSPKVSKMSEKIRDRLTIAKVRFDFEKPVCLVSYKIDFVVYNEKGEAIPVDLDGPHHLKERQQEKDAFHRGLLKKRFGRHEAIPYTSGDSKSEEDMIFNRIMSIIGREVEQIE